MVVVPSMVVIMIVARMVMRPMIGSFIMRVVVTVLIQRQGPLCAKPKQGTVFWCCRDNSWRTFAANVMVQADHPVTRSHNHVQIVADHQHACPRIAAHLCDQGLKRRLTRLV